MCDPPSILTTSTSSTDLSLVQSTASDDNSKGNNVLSSDASTNPLASGQQIPSEFCSVCDSDGQLIRSAPVTYDGNNISCGEFGWISLSENIAEGSDKCFDIRAQYAGTCCNTRTASDGCDLCNTKVDMPWHDVQSNKSVQFEGEAISCVELSDTIRTRFELASDQCLDTAEQYFNDCWYEVHYRCFHIMLLLLLSSHVTSRCYSRSFEKCSLCDDSDDLLWEATVFYSGVELSCHDLDSKIFVEKAIVSDTPTCQTSQDSYSEFCCIQPLEEPCDICSMNGVSFQMIDDMEISYEGNARTCLEVHNSLYSRREQSSELCISAQGNFFDQCCDDINDRQPLSDVSKYSVSRSPTMALSSPKPTEQFESWYTGALSSNAANMVSSIRSDVLPVSLGILLLIIA